MAQEMGPAPGGELTDQDKLMAALSYPIPIVALIILLVEDMKNRPFQKFHAVQALAANIALWVIVIILSCVLGTVIGLVTFGIGSLCGFVPWLLWFVTLYWAYLAYQGQYFDIPVITDFIKGQGWV
ncbi:MAG TPA: DUF4870 domain-containing protein [Anaerolineae bacterium]|nr:DUF4870 domain-containing protein [Anaerolineae bacterium]